MVTWCITVESENACGAWDVETEIITARREIMIAAAWDMSVQRCYLHALCDQYHELFNHEEQQVMG